MLYFINEGVTTIEIKSGYGLDKNTETMMLTVAKKLSKYFPISVCKTYLGAHALPNEYDNSDDYISFICEHISFFNF